MSYSSDESRVGYFVDIFSFSTDQHYTSIKL
jgi:hypothetical protein